MRFLKLQKELENNDRSVDKFELERRANLRLKLLSSLLRIAFYLFLTFAMLYFFAGYISSSEKMPLLFYRASILIGIFNLIFSFFGIGYCIFEKIKYSCDWFLFILFVVLRLVTIVLIVYFQTALYMLSKGEFFNV